ncbi:MAG: GFA family protein [Betaproteobacteria bacterium]|nr:GFA family protein [Betaproteobacteria bacterium]
MEPEKALDGSCLCGTVHYRVRGPWLRFMMCHCTRCRKVTGTAHATNLFAHAENFQWTAGESEVGRYELPTAVRFATGFCRACGSRVPSLSRDGKSVTIPAGSLDDDPGILPQARIYWGSRALWTCLDEQLPRFEEAPVR